MFFPRITALSTALALVFALASRTVSGKAPTHVRVAGARTSAMYTLLFGSAEREGGSIFGRHGLAVTYEPAETGADIFTKVEEGDADVALVSFDLLQDYVARSEDKDDPLVAFFLVGYNIKGLAILIRADGTFATKDYGDHPERLRADLAQARIDIPPNSPQLKLFVQTLRKAFWDLSEEAAETEIAKIIRRLDKKDREHSEPVAAPIERFRRGENDVFPAWAPAIEPLVASGPDGVARADVLASTSDFAEDFPAVFVAKRSYVLGNGKVLEHLIEGQMESAVAMRQASDAAAVIAPALKPEGAALSPSAVAASMGAFRYVTDIEEARRFFNPAEPLGYDALVQDNRKIMSKVDPDRPLYKGNPSRLVDASIVERIGQRRKAAPMHAAPKTECVAEMVTTISVKFDYNRRTDIGPLETANIESAVARAGDARSTRVLALGYSDERGSPAMVKRFGEHRARLGGDVAKAALEKSGASPNLVSSLGCGFQRSQYGASFDRRVTLLVLRASAGCPWSEIVNRDELIARERASWADGNGPGVCRPIE